MMSCPFVIENQLFANPLIIWHNQLTSNLFWNVFEPYIHFVPLKSFNSISLIGRVSKRHFPKFSSFSTMTRGGTIYIKRWDIGSRCSGNSSPWHPLSLILLAVLCMKTRTVLINYLGLVLITCRLMRWQPAVPQQIIAMGLLDQNEHQ